MGYLDNMTAVIAGADSEFALPLAKSLAGKGARLALVASRGRPGEQAAELLRLEGIEVSLHSATISADSVSQTLAEVRAQHGRPDILLTCPAETKIAASTDFGEECFRTEIEDNTVHAFLWCQEVGRSMLEVGQGVIVNVSALSGLGGWPGWLGQSVAMAGMHNLTHTLATEWSRFGVRVNCLVPGITEQTVELLMRTPEATDIQTVLERIPMGRLATSEDLGAALLYLVRPGASFISGEILRVDGAWDVWGRYYAVDPMTRRSDDVR